MASVTKTNTAGNGQCEEVPTTTAMGSSQRSTTTGDAQYEVIFDQVMTVTGMADMDWDLEMSKRD